MSDLITILLLSTFGGVLSLSGGILFLLVKKWTFFLTKYSIPFAAGVLLTIALIGLLPEAEHLLGESAFLIVLVTIIAAYLFESYLFDLHHHDHHCDPDSTNSKKHNTHLSSSAIFIVFGDTLHNMIDGVAIASSYLVSPALGLATAISTFLHEVPHEIGDFGILLKLGFSKTKILLINLFSSLATLVGAMMVYFWFAGDQFSGVFLSIASGMFLYLGASDFLPQLRATQNKNRKILALLLGVAMMYLALQLVGHGH